MAGSRGKNLLQVDAFGAVKLATAADKLGVNRFIMLSSWQSLQPSEWNVERMMNYHIAKFLSEMLERENTFKRVISMRQGETSIKSALDTFK